PVFFRRQAARYLEKCNRCRKPKRHRFGRAALMVWQKFLRTGQPSTTGKATGFARATVSCSTMKARGAAKRLSLAKSRVLLQRSNTGFKRNCSLAIWTRSEIGALRLSTLKASGEFCRLVK